MFRHGDRTPANPELCWPNDNAVYSCEANTATQMSLSNAKTTLSTDRLYRFLPINGDEFYGGDCFVGQLTLTGYEQELANGAALNAAYVGPGRLLSSGYNASYVYAQTDQSPRVEASVMAVLSGMFPVLDADDASAGAASAGAANAADPASRMRGTAASASVPLINIMFSDGNTDAGCPTATLCPILANYTADFGNSTLALNFTAQVLQPLANEFSMLLGLNYTVSTGLSALFDCHFTHACHDFALPAEVPAQLWAELVAAETLFTQMSYNYPNRTAYGAAAMGIFIEELVERMIGAINGTAGIPKVYLRGAHDSCVMPFLAAFGLMNDEWAPYAGVVVIELYALAGPGPSSSSSPPGFGTHAVRLIRYGEPVVIPGCTQVLCPFDEFLAAVKPLFPPPGLCTAGNEASTVVVSGGKKKHSHSNSHTSGSL